MQRMMVLGIFIQMIDMPHRIKAHVVPNNDGTYTIFLNSRLSFEQQQESYIHELRHIYNNDFGEQDVSTIEFLAHSCQ